MSRNNGILERWQGLKIILKTPQINEAIRAIIMLPSNSELKNVNNFTIQLDPYIKAILSSRIPSLLEST